MVFQVKLLRENKTNFLSKNFQNLNHRQMLKKEIKGNGGSLFNRALDL